MGSSDRASASARVAIGALMMFGAAGVGVQLRERERLVCARDAGTCTTTRELPFGEPEIAVIDLAQVRAHEFREVVQFGRIRGATVLTLASGAERMIADGELERARDDFAALAPFFTGAIDHVERTREPGVLGALVCAIIAIGGAVALVGGIVALRHAPPATSSPPVRPSRRPALRLVALVCVVAGALGLVYVVVSSTRAKLVLECVQRCDVNQTTCFPGQELELWTDPGEYTVRVWRPGPPESWSEHPVVLTAGQTTRFRCALEP